jgi:hypothetical protein
MSIPCRCISFSIAILLLGSLFAFAQDAKPLTLDDVRGMVGVLPDTGVRRFVNERKVDFDLTPEIENELKSKGSDETKISQETLDAIRVRRANPKGALEVICKPVDCDVLVNGNRLGVSPQGKPFKVASVDPALVNVTVRANGYKEQSAPIQVVANSTTSYEFVLEKNAPPPPPPPAPAATPPAPQPKSEPAPQPKSEVTQPKPEPALQPKAASPDTVTPQSVLNRIIEACGGVAALKGFAKGTANGNLTVLSKGNTTEVQVVKESILYPRSIKWELRIMNANWSVTSSPDETWTDGDVKYKTSDLAQQLEKDIRSFISMHLPLLLNRLQEKDVKGDLVAPASAGAPPVLVLQTPDDKYTITVDTAFRPTRIAHEAITGLQPKTEVTYGRYETTQGLTLPMSMTLRYGGQTDSATEILYSKIDPSAQPKDGDFKRSKGVLGGLIPKK